MRVAIVGAGPGGLSAAYALERAGIESRILERADRVCSSWYGHYRGLQLNSPRWLSSLPGAPMGREMGEWVPRERFLRYVTDYAGRLRTEPELGVEVERIERDPSGWRLATSAGEIAAPAVVVATGLNARAHWPEWPGRETFTGELLHVADYVEPARYRGRSVLVVGIGASGMDVAVELARAGVETRVAVRSTPVFFRRHASTAILAQTMKHARLPDWFVDPASLLTHRLVFGDLSDIGLSSPRSGMATAQKQRGHGGTIDRGLVSAARAGAISIVPAVDGFDGPDVLLADGSRLAADVVIAATGQRTSLEPLVGHLGVLGPDTRPVVHGGRTAPGAPGLFFIGYRIPPGQLGDMRPDSRAIARRVAKLVGARRSGSIRAR
jgi:cation diffusion facilitator CzcD-associated flavoprotein CzcO